MKKREGDILGGHVLVSAALMMGMFVIAREDVNPVVVVALSFVSLGVAWLVHSCAHDLLKDHFKNK